MSVESVIYALRLYFVGYAELKGKQKDLDDFAKLLGILSYPELGRKGRDHPEDVERLERLLFTDEQGLLAALSTSQRLIYEQNLPAEAEMEFRAMADLASFLYKGLVDRLFFTTERGECGLAPAMAEPGDALVRFLGLGVECLIRPVADSDDFRLIGPCYYHAAPQFDRGFGWIPLV